MRRGFLPYVLGILIAGAIANASSTYTGSLTYNPSVVDSSDELAVGPSALVQWVGYTVGISWTVTDADTSHPGFPWKYTYTFGHDGSQYGLSHVIIETSEGFSLSDITGLSGASIESIGPQTAMSGNPNLPEDMVSGIRFAPLTEGPLSMTWTFYSDRQPVWGDFYARCGGHAGQINYAYNYNNTSGTESGFLSPDTDPTADPSTGTAANHYYYHMLRPDSVPEPGTLALLALGGLAVIRRRHP
jgi:hypothetical protein